MGELVADARICKGSQSVTATGNRQQTAIRREIGDRPRDKIRRAVER